MAQYYSKAELVELVDVLPEGLWLKTYSQQRAELVDDLLEGRNQQIGFEELFSLFLLHNKCKTALLFCVSLCSCLVVSNASPQCKKNRNETLFILSLSFCI